MHDPIFFDSSIELSDWLEENHATASELWVGLYKKRNAGSRPLSMNSEDVTLIALCFGWTEHVRRSIDENRYMVRLTPRKEGGNWSVANVERASELIEAGMMRPAGLKIFRERDPRRDKDHTLEQRRCRLDAEYERAIRANQDAFEFWERETLSYRQAVCHWIMSAKREETRLKRLSVLIADAAAGQRISLLRRKKVG